MRNLELGEDLVEAKQESIAFITKRSELPIILVERRGLASY